MAIIIAYWGDEEDVLYCSVEDSPGEFSTIANAFMRYITKGHITEILEYYQDGIEMSGDILDERINYWREQLIALGYSLWDAQSERTKP